MRVVGAAVVSAEHRPAFVLESHQLVVAPVVRVRHNHLHLVGLLIWEGHVPAGVDLVQLTLVHVWHPVLTHVLLVLRAQTRGPPEEIESEGGN